MPSISLGKIPGVKKLRNVKDKAALKLIAELEKREREHETTMKRLDNQHNSVVSALDAMAELVAELHSEESTEERLRILTDNSGYKKNLAIIAGVCKEYQSEQQQLQRLQKASSMLSKLVSKDAALKEALGL